MNEAVAERIKEGYTGKKALRKDAVKNLTLILSGSHDEMIKLKPHEFDEWINTTQKWVEDTFDAENIVRFSVHMDEKTPHIHAVIVPITADGRLSAKDFIGDSIKLQQMQTSYAKAVKSFGFDRGVASERKHHDTSVWYKDQAKKHQDVNLLIKEANQSIDNIGVMNLNKARSEAKNIVRGVVLQMVDKMNDIVSESNETIHKTIREATYTPPVVDLTKIIQKKKFYQPAEIKAKLQEINIVDYFATIPKLGFTHKIGNEFYFGDSSQATGSIAVNSSTGLFFDHQVGKGGNLIEAIKVFEFKTYIEALERLFNSTFETVKNKFNAVLKPISDNKMQMLGQTILSHPALFNYTRKRGISDKIAIKNLKQVHYSSTSDDGKPMAYFGLGWKNQSDSFVVRNPLIKMNIGTSDISTIKGKNSDFIVFEGYFDYLSYLQISESKGNPVDENVVVLNSTNNTQKAIDTIFKHLKTDSVVHCFLDNDKAGDKATKLFKEKFEVVDMREQYLKFNDLNDYLQDIKSDAEEKIESSVKYKIRPGG